MRLNPKYTYRDAGVDIQNAEIAKGKMGELAKNADSRVLNEFGAFASLFLPDFRGIDNPVLVLKAEEPGSKQQLAFQYQHIKSICYDLIHHLVNDIVVMGAKPEVVLDTILCGRLESETVLAIVEHLAQACREQECSLIGGETSEQPGMLAKGQYMLNASILGVVDRDKIIDGSRIQKGDKVLALASNGLHTNGYSLVRTLIGKLPRILEEKIGEHDFLNAILLPHTCYYHPLKAIMTDSNIHGIAHITGGGIEGNLKRMLPKGTCARIDLSKIEIHPIFPIIQRYGQVSSEEMLQTFNMGVGLTVVIDEAFIPQTIKHLETFGCHAYQIGEIGEGTQEVRFFNELRW